VLFPGRADGSLIKRDGHVVGSKLIGQDFRDRPQYFQSRPSATGYSADATAFGNLGPNQRSLAADLRANVRRYRRMNAYSGPVPDDAVTDSASGIDPHISKANARIQARRVARVRRMPLAQVDKLIDASTDGRFLFFGEPGINVLELNLALDKEQRQ
jgi:potassium-transporting ATPase KdpC subunit